MNAMDLLDIIGGARADFVMDAQSYRERKPRRVSLGKPLLIGAIIALMLLLTGCAVYFLGLLDLKVGEDHHYNPYEEQTEVREVLSLQGFVGSKNYQASREWFLFQQSYAPSEEERVGIDRFPEEYEGYHCFSQTEREKIDEICEKYDLKLHGRQLTDATVEDMFGMLGIPGVMKQDADLRIEYREGGCYPEGSFVTSGRFTLLASDTPWPHEVNFIYRCTRKAVFDTDYVSIENLDAYQEWEYKTKDGRKLLLALGEDKALLIADREDSFVTVIIDSVQVGNVLDGEYTMDKVALETVAEVFDFTLRPEPVSEHSIAAMEQRLAEAEEKRQQELAEAVAYWDKVEGKESFDARIQSILERYDNVDRLGFLMADLTGDGKEELLIGKDGYISDAYTEKDGTTEMIADHSVMPHAYAYLCEGDILAKVQSDRDQETVAFFKIGEGELVWEQTLRFDANEENPWVVGDPETPLQWRGGGRAISEEEYNEIKDSFIRIPMDFQPLSEYPLEGEVVLPKPGKIDRPDSFARIILSRLEEMEHRLPEDRDSVTYMLFDMDGDGQEEMYLDRGIQAHVYAMVNGEVHTLWSTLDDTLCENGIMEHRSRYSGGNITYAYYRLGAEGAQQIEYLRYDADKDPENPWFRSSDGTGQDMTMEPISEAEFNAIRGKYKPQKLDLKPIGEFPMP